MVAATSLLLIFRCTISSVTTIKSETSLLPDDPLQLQVPCSSHYSESSKTGKLVDGCHPKTECPRIVLDGLLEPAEIAKLRGIADFYTEGILPGSSGNSILDIINGYVRDSQAGFLELGQRVKLSDLAFYKEVVERTRRQIMRSFGLSRLHYTAPSFIDRIRVVPNKPYWPTAEHDEYWHPHVDKNNTAHYDYSALLYLSEHGTDFEGGVFGFFDGPRPAQAMLCYDKPIQEEFGAPSSCEEYAKGGYCSRRLEDGGTYADWCAKSCGVCENRTQQEDERCLRQSSSDGSDDGEGEFEGDGCHTLLVEPRPGRLVAFSSGRENLHGLRRVKTKFDSTPRPRFSKLLLDSISCVPCP